MSGPTRIRVASAAPYDVVVGSGVLDELTRMLGGTERRRAAIVHPAALTSAADRVAAIVRRTGHEVHALEVPDGEAAKTADVAAVCWARLGRLEFTRSDVVVGIGGGATTDLAGFVAATFLRGIDVVHVPTSLLAMVDAAVGGKTGINTSEGKNLVGAFHEPRGVVCDLDWLRSLPQQDLVSGLAEVVKCGFIADPAILDLVVAQPADAVSPESPVLRELVERAIAVKASVVSADLRESAPAAGTIGREALNYGHTLGHAIERASGYSVRHGDAVAVGMVYVAEVARLAGRLDPATVDLHRRVLDLVGLPTSYSSHPWPDLRDAMRVDKKARGDRLRLVVLDGIARPVIFDAPPENLLAEAFAAIGR